jgi:hypothetical protein
MTPADLLLLAACAVSVISFRWVDAETRSVSDLSTSTDDERHPMEQTHKAVLLQREALQGPERRLLGGNDVPAQTAPAHPRSWTFDLKLTTLAPYAEASVTVGQPDEEPTTRRVSACMN